VFLHFQVASPMNYGNENVFSYPISFFYKLPINIFLVTTLAIMWSKENYLLVTCKKMKLDKKKLSLIWSQCIIWFKKFGGFHWSKRLFCEKNKNDLFNNLCNGSLQVNLQVNSANAHN